jgi:putative spermidine/putrescine transport system ATP-binding protein
MDRGHVVQSDPARTVYAEPRSAYVARFMGGQNVLSGKLESVKDGLATLRGDGGQTFMLHLRGAVHSGHPRLSFSVRRDHVRLTKAAAGSAPPVNAVSGMVRAVEYQGTFVKVTLRVDGSQDKDDLFVAYVEEGDYFAAPIGVADRACAAWDTEEVHALAAE